MNIRPVLNNEISIQDFRDFYWLKEELLQFCRNEKLDTRGVKIEISSRIEKFLATGERQPSDNSSVKSSSDFDWNNQTLTLETIITDNYKNTQNVREFFIEQIGRKFKFNVQFMNWMKTAGGKTLKDAVGKWTEISLEKKLDTSTKKIEPQFEYNTYIRDFMTDNHSLSRQDAIDCWKIKKEMRGRIKYLKSDLDLIQK